MFKLNAKFLKSSHFVKDLKLCQVRLHDNSKFPWIILIPKRKKITDISELNKKFTYQTNFLNKKKVDFSTIFFNALDS